MSKRMTETQIVSILKEAEAGIPAKELCRKYGIASSTFYKWKSKYGGMEASDVKRLKELEEENDKNLKWNIEKSYRDRISIMSDEESVNNLYFNRALTLKVLYSYELEELHDFFKVLEKEEFIRLITISFEKVKIFLELLRKGLNKWEIYDIFGKREFIMYLAEECIKRGIERIE